MAGISMSSGTLMLLLAAVVQYLEPVLSVTVGSTHIAIPNEGISFEGSNISLDCKIYGISQTGSFSCSKVLFLVNQTAVEANARQPILEDSRHSLSDADRSQAGKIVCSLTISELTVADSGMYGCCWADASATTGSRCSSNYPTSNLDVRPVTTTAPPTTTKAPTTTKSTTIPRTTSKTGKKISTPHTPKEYNSLPLNTEKNSVGGNDARVSNPSPSIHKTIWPILLIVAIIVIIAVVGYRYVKRRRTRDCDCGSVTVPSSDPEAGLPCIGLPDVEGVSHAAGNGTITTTTTTVTTIGGNRSHEGTLER